MPLWVPNKGDLLTQSNLPTVGSASHGTAVQTGASSSTKGTPVELIGSTSFDAFWVEIFAGGYAGNGLGSQGCLDILVGASTEDILIADLLFGNCGGALTQQTGPKRWLFPLYIPAGTRIAARAAGSRVSTNFDVGIKLYGGRGYPDCKIGSRVTTYGIGTVPSGTVIVPGGSGAQGSWTQITASTTEDHFCLVPSFQFNDTTFTAIGVYRVGIGCGSATEELLDAFTYFTQATESMDGPHEAFPAIQNIPASTRLVMRASSSVAVNTSNGAIHAVS